MFNLKFSTRTKVLGGLTVGSALGLAASVVLQPKELEAVAESFELIGDTFEEVSEIATEALDCAASTIDV